MDGILLKILKRDNFVKKKCQKTSVFNSKNTEKVLLLSKKCPAFSLLRRAEKKVFSEQAKVVSRRAGQLAQMVKKCQKKKDSKILYILVPVAI